MVERWSSSQSSQKKRLTAHWHTTCSLPCQPTSSALTVRLCWVTVGCHSVDGSELEVAVHRHAQSSGIRTFLCTQVFRHTNRVSGQSRPWTSPHLNLLKNGVKPGSSLSRAKAGNCTTDCNSPDNLSLSLLFLKSDLLDH